MLWVLHPKGIQQTTKPSSKAVQPKRKAMLSKVFLWGVGKMKGM